AVIDGVEEATAAQNIAAPVLEQASMPSVGAPTRVIYDVGSASETFLCREVRGRDIHLLDRFFGKHADRRVPVRFSIPDCTVVVLVEIGQLAVRAVEPISIRVRHEVQSGRRRGNSGLKPY